MYKSPINIYETADKLRMQIIKQQNEDIYHAVLSYGIAVDKEELLRALRYDREQYDKGYFDGKNDAMAELVRCKDCKHYEDHKRKVYENCTRKDRFIPMKPDDFCSYGERREE